MSQEQPPTSSNERIEDGYDEYLMPIWKSLDTPVKRADGCTLEDFEGNEYLDLFSGISVTNSGRGNDAIVDAAKEQLDELVHGCTYLHPHEPAVELGEKISEITPGDLQKSFFCNSGTEAIEGSIKLARKYTGSKEVISLEMGFHGRTLGSLALTGNKSYKADMAPTLNDVAHVAPPYTYRCQLCSGDECSCDCADDLKRVIDTHTADDLAAVVVEPVMGEAGIITPPDGWLSRIQDITHEHDALLIVDEVQTGYGRTGEMWGSDHFDIVPDILAQAKGIANGLPLGAFTASPEIADTFESGDHLSTFGGNPVACAAAVETIDQLQDGLISNASEKGAWLDDRLARLESKFDVVGETRGLGLMHGVELVDPAESGPQNEALAPDAELAKRVGKQLREEAGIVVGVGGFYSNVLRIQPPLPISVEQLSGAIDAIEEAIASEANE